MINFPVSILKNTELFFSIFFFSEVYILMVFLVKAYEKKTLLSWSEKNIFNHLIFEWLIKF